MLSENIFPEKLLGMAASLEKLSEHPLAEAVVAEAEKIGYENLFDPDGALLRLLSKLGRPNLYCGFPSVTRKLLHTEKPRVSI